MKMETASGVPSFRVLTRPGSSTTGLGAAIVDPLCVPISSASNQQSAAQSNSSVPGVVVVGVVGRSSDDVTQLLNRLLDAHIFGSGNRDLDIYQSFLESKSPETDFREKRISYYVDEEKGVVYVQFAWGSCHLDASLLSITNSKEYCAGLDHNESSVLSGLLYMFCVCHVVIFVHEGIRFETQLLKTFRTLQSAKLPLVSFVKTQIFPGLLPVPASGSSSRITEIAKITSALRGITLGQNSSLIGSVSGSSPNLFPGQCTPIMLVVFLDDLPDVLSAVSSNNPFVTNSGDSSPLTNSQGISTQQGSGILHIPGPSLHSKVSNPVVMLARSTNKSEGGFRKKLQTSLESQIRFLIKKCRIIAGGSDSGPVAGSGHGPRGPGTAASLSASGAVGPLFALDPSKAVSLLDRSANRRYQSLDAAAEEILSGKESLENLLSENNSNTGLTDDILSIKEFINRQIEMLRGRGGMAANSAGGSLGVGMVAAAAAAAAASAAAGGAGGLMKPHSNPPELPNFVSWRAVCYLLYELLMERNLWNELENEENCKSIDWSSISERKDYLKSSMSQMIQGTLKSVSASLECGKGLDTKFSAAWCERALPAAKDVYLKGLPASYPTSVHNAHLEKALHTFQRMVRGPAVQNFLEKLREDCEATWKSGRQLCDAVSLTGKPCIYQIHEVPLPSSSFSQNKSGKSKARAHSSGFVFLHACACGRSRRLRNDPFDFESANVKFFHFPNCEDNLPSLSVPFSKDGDPMGGSAWSLVRLGGSKYYDASVGLRQSGFRANENFLLKWTISVNLQDFNTVDSDEVPKEAAVASSSITLNSGLQAANNEDQRKGNSVSDDTVPTETHRKNSGKLTENRTNGDLKSNTNRVLPVPEMKKPFAEVVAKSNSSADSAFPPLRQTLQPNTNTDKVAKQRGRKERKEQLPSVMKADMTVSQSKSVSVVENCNADCRDDKPILLVGQNVVKTVGKFEKPQPTVRVKQINVYVGFEHECSHGHRCILSLEHLEKLGSPYFDSMRSVDSKRFLDQNTPMQDKQRQISLQQVVKNKEGKARFARVASGVFLNQNAPNALTVSKLSSSEKRDLQHALLNEGEGPGFSLLNMDLPIYMRCPHCRHSGHSDKQHELKFARTLSQLQRIFLVTPPFPIVLASCPVVRFEKSCIPSTNQKSEKPCCFSLGTRVILPPESFLSLRLPFVYGERLDDGSLVPLLPNPDKPELTAWIVKGTALQLICNGQEECFSQYLLLYQHPFRKAACFSSENLHDLLEICGRKGKRRIYASEKRGGEILEMHYDKDWISLFTHSPKYTCFEIKCSPQTICKENQQRENDLYQFMIQVIMCNGSINSLWLQLFSYNAKM